MFKRLLYPLLGLRFGQILACCFFLSHFPTFSPSRFYPRNPLIKHPALSRNIPGLIEPEIIARRCWYLPRFRQLPHLAPPGLNWFICSLVHSSLNRFLLLHASAVDLLRITYYALFFTHHAS